MRVVVSRPCAGKIAQGWGTRLFLVAHEGTMGIEAGGDHAAVVQHQKIARFEQPLGGA